jgi:hypothetical protein
MLLVAQMFGMRSLRQVFLAQFESGIKPDLETVKSLVAFDNSIGANKKMDDETQERRANSTIRWVEWIMQLADDRAK